MLKKSVYLIALFMMTPSYAIEKNYCETLNGSWKHDHIYAEFNVAYFKCEYAVNIHFSNQGETVTASLKFEKRKGYDSVCLSELNYEVHGTCNQNSSDNPIQLYGDGAKVWGFWPQPGRIALDGDGLRSKLDATGGMSVYIVRD